jgi:hypothetical protein
MPQDPFTDDLRTTGRTIVLSFMICAPQAARSLSFTSIGARHEYHTIEYHRIGQAPATSSARYHALKTAALHFHQAAPKDDRSKQIPH